MHRDFQVNEMLLYYEVTEIRLESDEINIDTLNSDPSQAYAAQLMPMPLYEAYAAGGVIPRWSLARQSQHASLYEQAKNKEWQQMFDLGIMQKIRKDCL